MQVKIRREVNAEGGQEGNRPTVLQEKYIVLLGGGGPCKLSCDSNFYQIWIKVATKQDVYWHSTAALKRLC